MRKLFVLVLALTSILLLPAPASAQRLYRLDAVEGPGSPTKFVGVSDCPPGDTITITSAGFVNNSSRATVGANGIFQMSATITSTGVRNRFITLQSARCAQKGPLEFKPFFGPRVSVFVPKGFELPFTGVPVLPRLALGLGLLVAGVLLLRLSPRPARRG